MNIEIELCGHKARLTGICSRPAYPPWQKEDELLVRVEFDQPYPEAIISTYISLPVKVYSCGEFLEVVKRDGEKQIAAAIAKHREEQEKYKREDEHKEALTAFAKRLEAEIEGAPALGSGV